MLGGWWGGGGQVQRRPVVVRACLLPPRDVVARPTRALLAPLPQAWLYFRGKGGIKQAKQEAALSTFKSSMGFGSKNPGQGPTKTSTNPLANYPQPYSATGAYGGSQQV